MDILDMFLAPGWIVQLAGEASEPIEGMTFLALRGLEQLDGAGNQRLVADEMGRRYYALFSHILIHENGDPGLMASPGYLVDWGYPPKADSWFPVVKIWSPPQ